MKTTIYPIMLALLIAYIALGTRGEFAVGGEGLLLLVPIVSWMIGREMAR